MTSEIVTATDEAFAFRLLGGVELEVRGSRRELGPEQEQRLLVVLLVAGGAPVTRDKLMAAVWDDEPPAGASEAMHHLVRSLRRRLEGAGLAGLLPRAANGTYRLDVPAGRVDLHQFHGLTARARDLAGHDDQLAADVLERALRLCAGEPLAGLGGRWIDAYRHTLTEERRAAELACHEVALRLGRHSEQVAALGQLCRERPGDERAAWLYMHALYRSGRQQEAFEAYHQVRAHLGRTTATESLDLLPDLYQRMLHGDASVLRPEAVRFVAAPSPGPAPSLSLPPADDQQHLEKDGETSMAWEHFTNTAQDHAQVGIQVGKVNGGVHHIPAQRAGSRASVRDALSDLYQALAASSRRGELDPAVFAAAEQELDVAAHLTGDRHAGRRALVAVLERLRNLLAGKAGGAGLALKIAGVIDLAEEMG